METNSYICYAIYKHFLNVLMLKTFIKHTKELELLYLPRTVKLHVRFVTVRGPSKHAWEKHAWLKSNIYCTDI